MNSAVGLCFKVATDEDEFEQIHELNYRTFVEEIPQHAPNRERRRVDRFHLENIYIICRDGKDVVGMVACRGNRPFSLDEKLSDLDAHLPPDRQVCEIRLLAIVKEYRRGPVFRGLLECLTREFTRSGFDLAVISGTLREIRLYRHLGFIPFGMVVGEAPTLFQPMYLTLESFLGRRLAGREGSTRQPVTDVVGAYRGAA